MVEAGRRRGTPWVLCTLTISMLGIGYAWAAQFARVPSLLENMGLSDEGVSLAFLAGPICGLLVQPIVGTLSDQTKTRWGRRRPWIFASVGLVFASFVAIGDAYAVGEILGDRGRRRPRAIAVTISAFWVLDFSQNAVQLPSRTLVSDVLVPEDVAAGNAMFSLFDGCGKLASYALAASTLNAFKLVEDEPDFASDARVQFGIAAVVAIVCVGITLIAVTEPPAPPVGAARSVRDAAARAWSLAIKVVVFQDARSSKGYELVSLHDNKRATDVVDDDDDEWSKKKEDDLDDEDRAPPSSDEASLEILRRMCLTELGLWFGLSAWQVWGAILVGKSIMDGEPAGSPGSTEGDREKFDAGVLLFSLGLAAANLVSLLLAPVYPALLRLLGARRMLLSASLAMAALMAALAAVPVLSATTYLDRDADTSSSFALVSQDPRFFATVLLLAALGFPWAAHMNVPFSTIGRAYQDSPDVGLYMATLNTSLCVAQLAMSFSTPILIRLARGSVTAAFSAGALAGLFAAYHAAKLEVPYDEAARPLRAATASH
ncbi:hypothetical protein CTAYLR_008553 [Chrysophaeum taylorii]|uniref:Sucrose transporter n=1 Tax=Chrysophaeum taylorii TaxID=2483200 RepID=A0AAD7XI96_9STRA|nr:hypothetical protein CTAYLR_008553 [Chrysophaeum taylorii]